MYLLYISNRQVLLGGERRKWHDCWRSEKLSTKHHFFPNLKAYVQVAQKETDKIIKFTFAFECPPGPIEIYSILV